MTDNFDDYPDRLESELGIRPEDKKLMEMQARADAWITG